jgi:hypothetical protein
MGATSASVIVAGKLPTQMLVLATLFWGLVLAGFQTGGRLNGAGAGGDILTAALFPGVAVACFTINGLS